MTDKEVIRMLTEQNERLLKVLEKFAEKEQNIVVNSYNGSSSYATADNEQGKFTGSNNIVGNTESNINQ